jgi:hypothetical protein
MTGHQLPFSGFKITKQQRQPTLLLALSHRQLFKLR